MDALKTALKKKLGNITITIGVGGENSMEAKEKKANEEGLAPPTHEGLKEGSPQEESLESPIQEQAEHGMTDALANGMSDHMGRKPMTLHEKVSMLAKAKMKHKK